ncbi:MAG: metal-sensitive transcriptional regulator [Chloroflexi bacterium]|nr:metal-sensitive transcriptional regulator [Chloroflexota bacterium]
MATRDGLKDESLRRISYIEGHLKVIRKMVEDDKYCGDVLKQTLAVRKAIQKLEGLMLEAHMRECVISGLREGREDAVIGELVELYNLAER